MLGLATIKDYDDYTYTHSVNVALLATCLGRQIGLSNVFLEYLTICGLFHDLGKVGVSKEILHKTGDLNEEEWNEMRNHPLIGVKKIIRLKAPHILKAKIILGPFEHHLNPDLTGYPQTHFIKELSLTGKILRIADVYEALTSDRDYRSQTFTPDEALRHMWGYRNKKFDLLLLKSFINMLGLYPIGSIVELTSGEIGLVIDYHDESAKHMPVILLLVDNGREWIRGEMVNIASPEQEADTQCKNIVRGINPALLGIQPSEFFCSI